MRAWQSRMRKKAPFLGPFFCAYFSSRDSAIKVIYVSLRQFEAERIRPL